MSQLAVSQIRCDTAKPPALTSSVRVDDNAATVFLSYSRRDMAFVDRLDADLQARGVKTLVDRAEIEVGEKWFDRLQDLISRAETIVFVLSPDSVRSKVCAEEVAYAKRLGKRFIPVVARRVDDPSVPEALSELNYVFFDDEATYAAQVDRLVRAIRTNLAWMRNHAEFGRAAEEWSRAGRPRGLLLGGTRLRAAETWIANRPVEAPLPTEDTRQLVAASRRAARAWRDGLIGALTFGFILALGLAALAYVQRQEAIAQRKEAVAQRSVAEQQTTLAQQREHEAREQRDVAKRNFDLARSTINTVILDLAQGLRQVDGIRTSVLRRVLSRVEAAMSHLTQVAPDDPDVQLSRVVMLTEFGDTYLAAGDGPGARTSYEEALKIIRAIAQRFPSIAHFQRGVAVCASKVGDLALMAGDTAEANAAYQEAFNIVKGLVRRDPDRMQWQRDLSVILNRIGDLKVRVGDSSAALTNYQHAIDTVRELVRRDPNNMELQSDLAYSLNKIGDLNLRIGDLPSALTAYQNALDMRRALARSDPDNTEWQREIAATLDKIGDGKRQVGDVAGALAAFQEALDIARAMTRRDPDNTDFQRNLSVSLNKVGDLNLRAGDTSTAAALYQEALDIRRALAKRDPSNTEWQNGLSDSLSRVAALKLKAGLLSDALAAFQGALDIRRALAKRDPTNANWQAQLAIVLFEIASALPQPDPRKREWLSEALAIMGHLQQAGLLSENHKSWPGMIRAELEKL